jgi:hypothetical protein
VEERPFRARVTNEKKKKSTLPKAVAGAQSAQATALATALDTLRTP